MKILFELGDYLRGSIYGHIHLLPEIEAANVIHASCVILVGMGIQDSIQPFDAFPEYLSSEVRASIYYQIESVYFYMNGRSCMRLSRKSMESANFAITGYDGHTLGGAGT